MTYINILFSEGRGLTCGLVGYLLSVMEGYKRSDEAVGPRDRAIMDTQEAPDPAVVRGFDPPQCATNHLPRARRGEGNHGLFC